MRLASPRPSRSSGRNARRRSGRSWERSGRHYFLVSNGYRGLRNNVSNRLTMGAVRSTRTILAAALAGVLGWLAGASPARAEEDEPVPVAPPDTGVPGPYVGYATRPALSRESRACSLRVPVCVHASGKVAGRTVLDVLAAAERAWETLAGSLGLGAPDVDADDLAYHVYLLEGAVRARGDPRERPRRSLADRSRASLHGARREPPRGLSARCARRARDLARGPRARRTCDGGRRRTCADHVSRSAHGAVRLRARGRRCAGLPVATGARGLRRARLRGGDVIGRSALLLSAGRRVHGGSVALLGADRLGVRSCARVDRDGLLGARADDDGGRERSAGTTSRTRSTSCA